MSALSGQSSVSSVWTVECQVCVDSQVSAMCGQLGMWKLGVGMWKLSVGMWKLGVEMWKLSVGTWKLGVEM